jgi:hypothetical protein
MMLVRHTVSDGDSPCHLPPEARAQRNQPCMACAKKMANAARGLAEKLAAVWANVPGHTSY